VNVLSTTCSASLNALSGSPNSCLVIEAMLVFFTFLPIWSPTKSSSKIGAPSFVASSTFVTESNTSYSTLILEAA